MTNSSSSQSASIAREISLQVLADTRRGGYVESALAYRLGEKEISPEDRNLATELSYGVVRWLDRLDYIIDQTSSVKKIQHQIRDILRIALYQIIFLDRIPPRAAVNEAVLQAAAHSAGRAGGFVNAVLRHVLREPRILTAPAGKDAQSLAVFYSHPQWLVEQWLESFDLDVTEQILRHNNSRAALELRVNLLKTSTEDLVNRLYQEGIEVKRVSDSTAALIIPRVNYAVERLPGFAEGLFTVQSVASQKIAPLLNCRRGEKLLDACAAPGGKTAQFAEMSGNACSIIAVDIDRKRIDQMRGNMNRLGVTCVEFVNRDALEPEFLNGIGTFDKILVDAPCSNLGVLRHNPEAKYRATPAGVGNMAENQLGILTAVAESLQRGGTMLYAVCTTTKEETVGVAGAFLSHRPDFSIDPISADSANVRIDENGFWSTFPPHPAHGVDGFFAARFRRL